MKTVKSPKLMLLKRSYEEGGRRVLFVGCGVGFYLDQPERLCPEKVVWTAVAQHVPVPAVFDAGFPKPAGEMLFAGHAAAPGGKPIQGLMVTAGAGPVRRRLAVFGNRVWQRKGGTVVFSEPEPFLTMPLIPSLAFGGPGMADNPAGIGHGAEAQLVAGVAPPLPNVERADHQIRHVADRPAPAIGGPLDIMAPSRQKLAGTYDTAWLRTQHPGFPTDMDNVLFHAAQPEQRLAGGFFRGDEAFEVAGMHAEHPHVTGHLPNLRPRLFVRLQGDGPAGLREVALRCETVWLLGSAMIGVVLWRGQIAVSEPEAADVAALMIAGERAGEMPREPAHYEEQFRLRTEKATAGLYALREAGLMPDPLPEAAERRAAARVQARAEMAERQQRTMAWSRKLVLAAIDPALHTLVPSMEPPPLPDDIPVVTAEEIADRDVDLAAIVDFALKQADAARALAASAPDIVRRAGALKDAMLAVVRGEEVDPAATLVPEAVRGLQRSLAPVDLYQPPPGPTAAQLLAAGLTPEQSAQIEAQSGDPRALVRDMLDRLLAPPPVDPGQDWEDARQRVFGDYHAVSAATAQGIERALDEAEQAMAKAAAETASAKATAAAADPAVAAILDEAAGMPAAPVDHQSIIAQLLDTKLPPSQATDPAAQQMVSAGQDAMAGALAGARDMLAQESMKTALALLPKTPPKTPDPAALRATTRAQLAKADESLRAGMAKANQARRFSPKAIVLSKPVSDDIARQLGALALQEHREGRGLEGLDFAGAAAAGADFSSAQAKNSFWEGAALSGANWTGAQLAGAVFTGADLNHAILARADLSRANFADAWLGHADLTDAVLHGAVLQGVDFADACLDRTQFDKPIMIGGKLNRASLRNSRITGGIFIDTDWSAADLRGARFERCIFMRGSLVRVRAAGAVLVRCGFVGMDAEGIDLTGAVLERLASIGGTSFRGAQLADARAAGSTWMKTDLTGADLAGADLTSATMIDATLDGAGLRHAILRRAILAGASLQDADLRDADLFEAMLRRADLRRADLRGANLYGSDMTGATMHLADLTDANLNVTQFELATDAA